ncbi:hypothetical protein pb186bvf_003215 [Paramecium bursaria]
MENPITERNIKTFKKSYQKISKEQREEVIRLIKQKKNSGRQIARITGLNPSTVKAIIRVYVREGRITRKPKRSSEVLKFTSFAICLYDEEKQSLKFMDSMKKYRCMGDKEAIKEIKTYLQQNISKLQNEITEIQSREAFLKNFINSCYQTVEQNSKGANPYEKNKLVNLVTQFMNGQNDISMNFG